MRGLTKVGRLTMGTLGGSLHSHTLCYSKARQAFDVAQWLCGLHAGISMILHHHYQVCSENDMHILIVFMSTEVCLKMIVRGDLR
jgi:hypothetical protein